MCARGWLFVCYGSSAFVSCPHFGFFLVCGNIVKTLDMIRQNGLVRESKWLKKEEKIIGVSLFIAIVMGTGTFCWKDAT